MTRVDGTLLELPSLEKYILLLLSPGEPQCGGGGMRLLVGHEEFYPIREAHVGEHADGEVIQDCFQAEVRLVASTVATLPTARLPRGQRWHTLVAEAYDNGVLYVRYHHAA